MGRKVVDLTGQKFGLLTVIERDVSSKGGGTKWLCVCDCGKKTVVTASNLKSGRTKSCGCICSIRRRKGNNYTFFNDYCVGEDKRGRKFTIDLEDYKTASLYTWSQDNKTRYWRTPKGLYLHTLIMNTQKEKGQVIDHIDGNPSNNRKSNLRICTVSENGFNRGKPKNNTSGAKGVSWNKKSQKWCARIMSNGKDYIIGLFDTIKEASDAYDAKAIELHGEFARLNNYQENKIERSDCIAENINQQTS